MASPIIEFMLARNSPPIHELKEPGPNDDEIATILKVASHVPDHGRLAPWRFILYRGAARYEIGEALVALAEKTEGPMHEGRREKERTRFSRAPLVVGVVSSPKPHNSIPQWEMFLSGGAAAMALVLAATALGFGANWVSNWYSDSEDGRSLLGLAPDERVIGFVHIGNHDGPAAERERPAVESLYQDYSGPWRG